MLRWEWIAIGYSVYLAVVALASRRYAKARVPTLAAVVACPVVLLGLQPLVAPVAALDAVMFGLVVPALMLLIGYWLSGLFFVSPMPRVERWLTAVDDRWLRRTGILAAYGHGPRTLRDVLELSYLLVYVVVPAGVVALAVGRHGNAVPRFWAVVLLSEFLCYGALPWVQTRSPRVFEDSPERPPSSRVRQLNLRVLDRGSIQANTVPSGHAAGAVATALAVIDVMPATGSVFLIVAAGIVAATVLGRYHYLVDSLLGILVALAVWVALS